MAQPIPIDFLITLESLLHRLWLEFETQTPAEWVHQATEKLEEGKDYENREGELFFSEGGYHKARLLRREDIIQVSATPVKKKAE